MCIATIVSALFVLLITIVIFVFAFNALVSLRNRQRNAFAQIDVQLKRRHDLIPNLVESVKGFMAHERATLDAVMKARSAAVSASSAVELSSPAAVAQMLTAEGGLTAVLGRFRGLAEAYPDLRAHQSTALLMEELATTENRIGFARQAYNDATMAYNTRRETFPAVFVAGPLGFTPAALFQVDDASERANVRVSLS